MKARTARLGVLIAATLGLMATMTPAQADWVKNVTLVGGATLTNCGGLGSPGSLPDTKLPNTDPSTVTVKTGPKGEPVVNINPGGNHCDFTLSTTVCVKESIGKKTGVDLCVITAIGKVWGFCGLSTGEGTAVLTNLSGTKEDVVTNFKFTGTGGTLVVTGGNSTQNIHGEVTAVPTTGSCTNKTATGFTVAGDVVIKHLN